MLSSLRKPNVGVGLRGGMSKDREDEIEDVVRAEQSGVKGKQIDRDAIRRRQECLNALRILVQKKDKRGFLDAIRAYGIKDGTPEFQKMVELWDDVSRLLS